MRLLLDTHILLIMIDRRAAVSSGQLQRVLADPANTFLVSVASLWEIAIKWRLGKLQIVPALERLPHLLARMGIELVVIKARHALTAVNPAPPTRDPFDRLLLAQCQVEDLQLVTLDRALISHPLAIKFGVGP